MDYKELIQTAYCCDIKACDDCPSNGRTCCRERAMHELSSALNREMARAEAAEARAEKAERERDAAIRELENVAAAVDDLSDFIDEQIHPLVQYDMYLSLRENADSISMWQYESEWRGQKEG